MYMNTFVFTLGKMLLIGSNSGFSWKNVSLSMGIAGCRYTEQEFLSLDFLSNQTVNMFAVDVSKYNKIVLTEPIAGCLNITSASVYYFHQLMMIRKLI